MTPHQSVTSGVVQDGQDPHRPLAHPDNSKRATLSVVSHGQGDLVVRLLADLLRQTISESLEIVVTLNLVDEAIDLEPFGALDLKIIRNEEPAGFGQNHNQALARAKTPWVLIVNPDIRIVDETLIERLLIGSSHADLGLRAPLVFNSNGDREDSIRRNIDIFSITRRVLSRRKEIIDPDAGNRRFFWVAGMFMALPARAWREVGGFDERYFLYCEDYDLCARLAVKGYRMEVDMDLTVVHDARRASRKSLRHLRMHVLSMLQVWTSPFSWKIWLADRRAKAGLGVR
jgi:N-acetylglucosaminyl-diphospho-decaprenol L-rhamnosyltransferase